LGQGKDESTDKKKCKYKEDKSTSYGEGKRRMK
jgi:hypothetical protein